MRRADDSFNLEWCDEHNRWCPDGECWECHDANSQADINELKEQITDLENKVYELKNKES